jgi:hypothetical protein
MGGRKSTDGAARAIASSRKLLPTKKIDPLSGRYLPLDMEGESVR